MYQKWTATVHEFLKVPTTDYVVYFSEHIARTAILTQASVIRWVSPNLYQRIKDIKKIDFQESMKLFFPQRFSSFST